MESKSIQIEVICCIDQKSLMHLKKVCLYNMAKWCMRSNNVIFSGNLVRLPYLAAQNGGAAFFIPYCITFLFGKYKKFICIPESFHANISYQYLNYKITFVNSQYSHIFFKINGFKDS